MIIKSLNIQYTGEIIITDIDDCLMFTSRAIQKNGFTLKDFWFDEILYTKWKKIVFESVELTEWGIELIDLISKNIIDHAAVIFITAAPNRFDILKNIYPVTIDNLHEGMSDNEKTNFINNFQKSALYVDDKMAVLDQVDNPLVKKIKFPIRFKHAQISE